MVLIKKEKAHSSSTFFASRLLVIVLACIFPGRPVKNAITTTAKERSALYGCAGKALRKMERNKVNVTIGGEAGQGLVTVGALLAKGLHRCGYDVFVTQSYMSRVRGGNNAYIVSGAVDPIHAQLEEIDILVALDAESVDIYSGSLAKGSMIVADEALGVDGERVLRAPFKDLAENRYHNIVALGLIGCLLGLDHPTLSSIVHDTLGHKKPEMAEKNLQALEAAYAWGNGKSINGFKLAAPKGADGRLLMNGNEAIALGCLSAGVKFCAFYPMTPSTSIPLALTAWAKRSGLVVEQVEDEIGAINMTLGASYAGAPSMVATSGGGFALMTEGVSLAGMTEVPIVIAVAQRPGPATGLPTRTEQGDLEFVLHSGHGEFPRVLFAPGSPEECFHLARAAFDLAERYQIPAFILTDQYLADAYRSIPPFDVSAYPPVKAGSSPNSVEAPYKRYRITKDGISPRLLPGASEHLVVIDSDEHCEFGHITEDLSIRVAMMDKRMRKMDGIMSEVAPPELFGDEKPELLLLAWGSTKGPVFEAVRKLKEEGASVAVLHFKQVWPLREDQFLPMLERAKEVVCVEGNATGQFGKLLRRKTGFRPHRCILRYDGLQLTPRYILEALKKPASPETARRS